MLKIRIEMKIKSNHSLGFDRGHHFRLVEREVRREVDCYFKLWQNVLGHLEDFGGGLAWDDGRYVPVAQDGLVRQGKFGREDTLFGKYSVPLLDSVTFSILNEIKTSRPLQTQSIEKISIAFTVIKTSMEPVTEGFSCGLTTMTRNWTVWPGL